jgi:hypothetical protein
LRTPSGRPARPADESACPTCEGDESPHAVGDRLDDDVFEQSDAAEGAAAAMPSRTAYAPWRARVERPSGEVPQPHQPSSAPAAPPGDDGRELTIGDDDIDQLEASLRWLRRQADASSAAAALPPSYRRSSRLLDSETFTPRSPLSLEPVRMPPPPRWFAGGPLRWPLRIVIAGGALAPLLYFVSAGPSPAPQTAAFEPAAVASITPAQEDRPSPAHGADPDDLLDPAAQRATAPQSIPIAIPASARRSVETLGQPGTAATPQGSRVAAAPPAAESAIRQLAAPEIALLMQQGEQFIAAGDLVSARTVLQRAAETGDATAAIAIGATYDPLVLRKLSVIGMEGDVEKARSWYQRAERLGSSEATRRLELLARR